MAKDSKSDIQLSCYNCGLLDHNNDQYMERTREPKRLMIHHTRYIVSNSFKPAIIPMVRGRLSVSPSFRESPDSTSSKDTLRKQRHPYRSKSRAYTISFHESLEGRWYLTDLNYITETRLYLVGHVCDMEVEYMNKVETMTDTDF